MTNFMNLVQRWLADPNIVKLIEVGIGILIISIISRILAQGLSRQVQDSDLRYRIRKIIGFLSYGFIALLIVTVFNDSLRQLTVVFGVVGAGIAFALQEVIASLAGWTAISLGQFYKTGDRVQLGGIMGDVIDVSPLRTTLMECG
ncbi:MAG: mechanosensitive ion channel, partial [Methylacidiphilales bacterium]|nr:mechanosensitive ion channel [Candidatus Methylacidiphilales bacterium]